jgi:hypothetical protein
VLIAWAVPCDSYELHDDGTADIFGAGFDTFHVETLPAELELTVVTRLLLMEDEHAEIELQVLGPDTTPLGTLIHGIDAEPGPGHRAGYTVNQTEVLEIGFLAETEGVYSLEIYTDGERASVSPDRRRSIFLTVREGLPEQD